MFAEHATYIPQHALALCVREMMRKSPVCGRIRLSKLTVLILGSLIGEGEWIVTLYHGRVHSLQNAQVCAIEIM